MPLPKGSPASTAEPPAPDIPKSELVEAFAKLLNTGKGSELTITCNGTTSKVHKAIIASRSECFKVACWAGLGEVGSSNVDLPDKDTGLVKKMMEFLYVLDYESDKDVNVCIDSADSLGEASPATGSLGGAPSATDLAIEGCEDFQMRTKVQRLQRMSPRPEVHVCLNALNENNLDRDKALASLGFEGLQHGQVQSVLRQEKKAAEIPVMSSSSRLRPIPELAIHASMYGVGGRYGIGGLQSIALHKLRIALQSNAWVPDTQKSYMSIHFPIHDR